MAGKRQQRDLDEEQTTVQRELTFLWTSVRMTYSAERSRQAFRLGSTEELNGSGENLWEDRSFETGA